MNGKQNLQKNFEIMYKGLLNAVAQYLGHGHAASKIDEIESKLSKYKETNKRMLEIILEQKMYIEKIKNLTEFKSKTESRLLSFDIKLNNFFSELVSFKNKYDKIIVDNLTIPGIIGVSCKFNTIADYIIDNINKNKLIHAEQEKIKSDVHSLKRHSEKKQRI